MIKLKQLAKDKIGKISFVVLEKELRILQDRIIKHEELIKNYLPIKEQLVEEGIKNKTLGEPSPYSWYEDPLRDVCVQISVSESMISKTKKKMKIIEYEMIDRVLTGDICEA